MGKLTLSDMQDGMGFFYGTFTDDYGHSVRVDVLPPKSHPRPYFVLDTNERQHDTAWLIFLGGEEVAHVSRREDIEKIVSQKLLPST